MVFTEFLQWVGVSGPKFAVCSLGILSPPSDPPRERWRQHFSCRRWTAGKFCRPRLHGRHDPHEEGRRLENCSSSSSASAIAATRGVGGAQGATQKMGDRVAGEGKGSFLLRGSLPDRVPWLSKGVDRVDCTDVSLGKEEEGKHVLGGTTQKSIKAIRLCILCPLFVSSV